MHPRITKSQSQRNTNLQLKGNFRNFKNQQLYIILGFLDLLKTQERALSDWTVFLLTHPMVMMMPASQFEAFRKSSMSALTVMIFDADGAAKVGLTYSSPHPTNHRPHFQAQRTRQGGFDSILTLKGSQPLVKWCHLVAKFATDASGAIWWPNLQLMHVVPCCCQI